MSVPGLSVELKQSSVQGEAWTRREGQRITNNPQKKKNVGRKKSVCGIRIGETGTQFREVERIREIKHNWPKMEREGGREEERYSWSHRPQLCKGSCLSVCAKLTCMRS